MAAKDAEAAQKAQDILDEWKAGDPLPRTPLPRWPVRYSQDPGPSTAPAANAPSRSIRARW